MHTQVVYRVEPPRSPAVGTAICRKPTALVVCPPARHLPSLSPSPLPMEGRHELRATASLDFGHSPDPSLPGTPLMIGQLIPMDNVLLRNRTRLIPSQEECTCKSLRGQQRLQQLLSVSRSPCTLAGGQSQPRGHIGFNWFPLLRLGLGVCSVKWAQDGCVAGLQE